MSEPLFSKKNLKLLSDPMNNSNPITVQVLGICSALAVTAQLKPSIVMAISVTAVLALANVIISLLRNTIPNRIRIIVQLVVIAALVILVDQVLKAYVFDVSRQLSVFVGLIITNCIIMGRAEAFYSQNNIFHSVLDSVANGFSYTYTLVAIAIVREILGFGTLLGFQIMPETFPKWVVISMAPGAFFVVSLFIWITRTLAKVESD